MISEIKKIGNSKGIVIPSSIIKMFDLKEKDELEIKVVNNQIVLSLVNSFNPKSLAELFVDYQGQYKEEVIFDNAVGEEVW